MTIPLFDHHSLINIAGRSFVLLLLTLGLAVACRRRSAAVIHGIWAVGLGATLLIPCLSLASPVWSLPLLPPEVTALPTVVESAFQHVITPPIASVVPTAHPLSTRPGSPTLETSLGTQSLQSRVQLVSPTPHPAKVAQIEWPSTGAMLFAIWTFGSVVILIRLLRQVLVTRNYVRRATDIDTAEWHHVRDDAAQQLGMRRPVPLKLHGDALSPMVAGLLLPAVLLPGNSRMWSPDHRRLVLLHELAHVQRHDVLTQMMAALVCAMYWFNPLAWWGANRMKALREMACDDAVLKHASVPANYAQTLLDIAKNYRCRQLITTVAMARMSQVESRINSILSSTRSRVGLSKRSVRILMAAALGAAVVVGTCRLRSRADDPQKSRISPQAVASGADRPRVMVVRVLDGQGQPLADANIFANISLVDAPKTEILNRNYRTDDQGRAEVPIPNHLHILRLWPSKQGYVPQFVNFAEGTHEDGRLIPKVYEFRLQPGHRLSGHIFDKAGKPITNARVQVKVEGGKSIWGPHPEPMINTWLAEDESAAVTDLQGRWEITNAPAPLATGDYLFRLQITHPDFAGDTKWGEIQDQQGITTPYLRDGTATIVLDSGCAIKGAVTGPDGTPVKKGLVIWNVRPYWATGENETQIHESGRYETKHLAPGRYPLTVLAPGFAPHQQMIELNQDLKEVDIQLQAGNPIRIEIIDQFGKPVHRAYVGIGAWRGTEAIYNEKHPNVPDSGIPRRANDQGIYEWGWAPTDGVEYRISAKGFDTRMVTLVAQPQVHRIELVRQITISGTVVDASSGEPVKRFRVIPVKAFRPDWYSTDFQANSVAEGQDGKYRIQIDSNGNPDNRYRVRIEADGYRTDFGQKSLVAGDPQLVEDFRLEPAPAMVGEVLDADGNPVHDFTVAIGTPTTSPQFSFDHPDSSFGQAFHVHGNHRFELPATFEPQRIRAYNDKGIVEVLRQPDEPIGTLRLQSWAALSGRLMQGETPVANEGIYFQPLVRRGLREARFQDSFYAKTAPNGEFQFERLPPMRGAVKAHLSPWQDSPLTSSESVPIDLRPGEHREVLLGSQGPTITGRVIATGRHNDSLSKNWSLNFLVSRDRSDQLSNAGESWNFQDDGPVKTSWLQNPEFSQWVASRLNYFAKLTDDGQLRIHGVRPGEYDLVIQLYEQPAGCLVEAIGQKIIPVTVKANQNPGDEIKLGDIEVECRQGPRVGADMRAYAFTDSTGRVLHVSDLSGQYVLFHAWASWCVPCLESMPAIKSAVELYADKPLTVVGLNIDENTSAAKSMAQSHKLNWSQNFLGSDSNLARQLAINSVPAYYLIGPEGTLIGSANEWKQMEELLRDRLQ